MEKRELFTSSPKYTKHAIAKATACTKGTKYTKVMHYDPFLCDLCEKRHHCSLATALK